MHVHRVSPDGRRPNDHPIYRGTVEMQAVVTGDESGTHNVLEIAFKHGARTNLYTHESDRILIITEGNGVVGTPSERREVRPATSSSVAPASHTSTARPMTRT